MQELYDFAQILQEELRPYKNDTKHCNEKVNDWINDLIWDGVDVESIAECLSVTFKKDDQMMLDNVIRIKKEKDIAIDRALTMASFFEPTEKPQYVTHYYTPDEIKIIACDINANVPVKRIAKIRGEEFNRKGDGMLKKIRQIKRALAKGFTIEEIINNKTTEAYNKQPEAMNQVRFYTTEEINIIKTDIATGEPIKQISKRLSKEFDRPILGLEQKMYLLKKEVPVIAKWNGPRLRKRTRGKAKKSTTNVQKINFEPTIEQQPAEIGIEVPHGMTFEGKPKKIMLHSDHFRIYF